MRRFFEPAAAPFWLKAVLSSIRAALGDVWDVPLRPFQAAAADLPAAAAWRGALAWNATASTISWSDGTEWKRPQGEDAGLTALAALAATGLVARTGAGAYAARAIAGTANEISVADGDGVAGGPIMSLPAAITLTGKTLTGGTFTGTASISSTGSIATTGTNIQVKPAATGGAQIVSGTDVGFLRFINADGTSAGVVGFKSGTRHELRAAGGFTGWLLTGDLNVTTDYKLNGTKVVGARRTGWSTATGTATRTGFDTATVTLPQLAERVKALIDDLHGSAGHGLIGT